MQGFTRRHTVQEALTWLDARLRPLGSEDVPLRDAAGRVLASAVVSDIDVPGFDRSTMDGYAVVADSTEGATPYNRIPLKVVGDAMPGSPFARTVVRGEAVRIMTGAPMPSGADSVLPAESVDVAVERGLHPRRHRTRSPLSPRSHRRRTSATVVKTSFAARRCSRPAVCCGRRTSAS
jgi:molybdopterin molybdotransferase